MGEKEWLQDMAKAAMGAANAINKAAISTSEFNDAIKAMAERMKFEREDEMAALVELWDDSTL